MFTFTNGMLLIFEQQLISNAYHTHPTNKTWRLFHQNMTEKATKAGDSSRAPEKSTPHPEVPPKFLFLKQLKEINDSVPQVVGFKPFIFRWMAVTLLRTVTAISAPVAVAVLDPDLDELSR